MYYENRMDMYFSDPDNDPLVYTLSGTAPTRTLSVYFPVLLPLILLTSIPFHFPSPPSLTCLPSSPFPLSLPGLPRGSGFTFDRVTATLKGNPTFEDVTIGTIGETTRFAQAEAFVAMDMHTHAHAHAHYRPSP